MWRVKGLDKFYSSDSMAFKLVRHLVDSRCVKMKSQGLMLYAYECRIVHLIFLIYIVKFLHYI